MNHLAKQMRVLFGLAWLLAGGNGLAADAGSSALSERRSLNVLEYRKHQAANLPKFEQYPAKAVYNGVPARIVLDTEFKRGFRTRLRHAATLPADFAGDHVLALWGCGSNCIMGAAVNLKTGYVVELPGSVSGWLGDEDEGDKLQYRKDSRLLIARGYINEGEEYGRFYYEFTGREFKLLRMLPADSTAHRERAGIKMRQELENAVRQMEHEKQRANLLQDGRPHGWVGVEISALTTEAARDASLRKATGVLIASVYKNGPAERAGIRPGDVLTHINGQLVGYPNDLMWLVDTRKPGSVINLMTIRRGERKTYSLILAQRPKESQ